MSENKQNKTADIIPSNIHYREYLDTDLKYVQSLMNELGYSVAEEDLSANIKEIQQRDGVIYVAEFDNRLIACICSMVDARLAEGVYGEIVSLIVSEKSRGVGVGSSLVRLCEKWLSKRVGKMRVRANEVRSKAHSFYTTLGYKEVKTQKVFIKKI